MISCSVLPLDSAVNGTFRRRDGQRDLGRVRVRAMEGGEGGGGGGVTEGQGRPKTRSRKLKPDIRKILQQRSGSTEADAMRS